MGQKCDASANGSGLEWSWTKQMASRLRFPFPSAGIIAENYSQSWQDIFVLSMLDGLRNGRYLEIGAQEPCANSNTYLLQKHFGWSGVSVELEPAYFTKWRCNRSEGNLVIADALTIDYVDALPKWYGPRLNRGFLARFFNKTADSTRIDYLQLDIDPSLNTLAVLKRIPLDRYRFSVITFETDAYAGDNRARNESREILHRHGYELVGRDISVLFPPVSPEPIPFEDWWVDPRVVDEQKIKVFRELNRNTSLPQELLFL